MSKFPVEKRITRHKRVRAKITGTETRPRLSVFRSNRFLYAQIIDDQKGKTLASINTKGKKGSPLEQSKMAGEELAKMAKSKKIESIVFDRGGFLYKGKVKALADGLREGGLKF